MAGEIVTIVVNGATVRAERGRRLLDVLEELGIAVPTLCHDPRLEPQGGCRLCLVARRDRGTGLVTACSTPVERGMVIDTASPEVAAARRRQLELIMQDHRMECPVCDESGVCRLQRYLFEYGVGEGSCPIEPPGGEPRALGPALRYDRGKCILCRRCVRTCEELVGVGALGVVGRGAGARISGQQDLATGCDACGACVAACPVGALTGPGTDGVPAWLREEREMVCTDCALACRARAQVHDGAVVRVEPASGDLLCARGWLGHGALAAAERALRPLVRDRGELREATWEEALERAAGALARAAERGRAVTAVASPDLLNEDAYLLQRFLRTALGSSRIVLAGARGVEAVEAALEELGAPPALGSLDELGPGDVVVVAGEDPALTHPAVRSRLVAAVRAGARLVHLPPRRGVVGRLATSHVAVAPGRQAALLDALAAWSRGEAMEAGPWAAERVAGGCGCAPEAVRRAAETVRGARRVLAVVVVARAGHEPPGELVRAALGMLEATPPRGATGGRLVLLPDGANLLGAMAMGLGPERLPGWRVAADPEHRAACEAAWETAVPEAGGEGSELGPGDVALLVGDGLEPGRCGCPGIEELERCAAVVVLAAFPGPLREVADVILPRAVLMERRGHLLAVDGRVRWVPRVVPPAGWARQDGEIVAALAARLGRPQPTGAALRRELGALGAAPRRPAREGGRRRGGPPAELPAGRVLVPGPSPGMEGGVARRSPALAALFPRGRAWLPAEDAAELGVATGDPAVLASAAGRCNARLVVDPELRPGVVVGGGHGVPGEPVPVEVTALAGGAAEGAGTDGRPREAAPAAAAVVAGWRPDPELEAEVEAIVGRAPSPRAALLPALWAVVRRHGWLPPGARAWLGWRLGLGPAIAEEVASFYELFELHGPRRVVGVCGSLSCRLCGAAELERTLRERAGQGTEVRRVHCLGQCDGAPAALVDGRPRRGSAEAILAAAGARNGGET